MDSSIYPPPQPKERDRSFPVPVSTRKNSHESDRTRFLLSREEKGQDSKESSQDIFYYKNNVLVELRALTHGKNSGSCVPKGRTQGHAYPGVELMVLTQGYNSGRFPREYTVIQSAYPRGRTQDVHSMHAYLPSGRTHNMHTHGLEVRPCFSTQW